MRLDSPPHGEDVDGSAEQETGAGAERRKAGERGRSLKETKIGLQIVPTIPRKPK